MLIFIIKKEKRELSLSYNFLYLKDSSERLRLFLNGSLKANLTEELKKQTFVNFSGSIFLNLWSQKPYWPQIKKSLISYCLDLKQSLKCNSKEELKIQNLYQANIELFKVLDYSYYPLKIPFSLRRIAPLLGGSILLTQDFYKDYRFFLIPFIGLEGEMGLLSEKLIVNLGLSVENRIELFKPYKDSVFQFSLWLKNHL
ncbi:MAG: hypothetical protein OXC37_05530 [Bdellovibrionaceae bacterium]|nr:hypothetical protein [Pseudobdellovibrionaceae bacterium]